MNKKLTGWFVTGIVYTSHVDGGVADAVIFMSHKLGYMYHHPNMLPLNQIEPWNHVFNAYISPRCANNWLLIMGIARHLLKSEKGKEKVEDNSTDGEEGDDNVSLSQLASSSRPFTLWPATMDEIDELVNLQ
ncbi:hypothetical protein Fot_06178 [Forsythia ovata]|uniref:Uncharacterized protein n=1 Tax=Forsythia ovata TaxID=205694 RepID=A0ABD1WSE3_9LAMI